MTINAEQSMAPRSWITIGDGQEPTFKGIILPATRWRRVAGHDHAIHSSLDVPGGIVETTGRKPYRIEIETVWTGPDWQARLANAEWVHNTDPTPGELVVPDGPTFDVVWTDFSEDRATKENGTRVSLVFVESSDVDSPWAVVPKGDPFSRVRAYVPDSDAEELLPLVDAYEAACESGLTDAMTRALEALVALDTAAYFASVAKDMADEVDAGEFEDLIRVRANARRAWPVAWDVDLGAVLGCR